MQFSLPRRCAASMAAITFATAAQANSYSIVDLGTDQIPSAINSRGDIAGRSGTGDSTQALVGHGAYQGEVTWRKLRSQGKPSVAMGVSDGHDIVGAIGSAPVLWINEKGTAEQVKMPDDFVSGVATVVYSFKQLDPWDGLIGGNYTSKHGKHRCFRSRGLTTTVAFPAQGDECTVTGISDQLDMVGGANETPGGPMIAFEIGDLGFQYLGALAGGNPPSSIAMSVSASHGAVGCSATADSEHAVLFKTNRLIDIGASADYPSTCAYSIDRYGGKIVGTGNDTSGNPHAVRFADGQVIALESEVQALGGWMLQRASGVNASGYIVGDGLLNGVAHGFLLIPVN